jgi:hypothetical protein
MLCIILSLGWTGKRKIIVILPLYVKSSFPFEICFVSLIFQCVSQFGKFDNLISKTINPEQSTTILASFSRMGQTHRRLMMNHNVYTFPLLHHTGAYM